MRFRTPAPYSVVHWRRGSGVEDPGKEEERWHRSKSRMTTASISSRIRTDFQSSGCTLAHRSYSILPLRRARRGPGSPRRRLAFCHMFRLWSSARFKSKLSFSIKANAADALLIVGRDVRTAAMRRSWRCSSGDFKNQPGMEIDLLANICRGSDPIKIVKVQHLIYGFDDNIFDQNNTANKNKYGKMMCGLVVERPRRRAFRRSQHAFIRSGLPRALKRSPSKEAQRGEIQGGDHYKGADGNQSVTLMGSPHPRGGAGFSGKYARQRSQSYRHQCRGAHRRYCWVRYFSDGISLH